MTTLTRCSSINPATGNMCESVPHVGTDHWFGLAESWTGPQAPAVSFGAETRRVVFTADEVEAMVDEGAWFAAVNDLPLMTTVDAVKLDTMATRLAELERQRDAVLALHVAVHDLGDATCTTCRGVRWPCPTVGVLGGGR